MTGPTQVKRASSRGSQPLLDDNARLSLADIPTVTGRRRLPVDDEKESDGAQAEEEPLAGSRVRVGLGKVDTRRRSDEGRRQHSMIV